MMRIIKRRNKKGYSEVDHASMTSHDPKDVSDSLAHPDGLKLEKQKQKSQKKDDVNPLRNIHKINEDDNFIEKFLDKKIEHQARMTTSIKSTLGSLEKNRPRKIIISESDSE